MTKHFLVVTEISAIDFDVESALMKITVTISSVAYDVTTLSELFWCGQDQPNASVALLFLKNNEPIANVMSEYGVAKQEAMISKLM